MDYRKDVRTPKDRVDDDLLRRLLDESDALLGDCGCNGGYDSAARAEARRSTDSTVRNSAGNGTCRGQRDNGVGRTARREDNDGAGNGGCGNGNGCGCGNVTGCGNETGCGCSCGCRNNGGCGCSCGCRNNSGCGCKANGSGCGRHQNGGCGCGGRRSDAGSCGCAGRGAQSPRGPERQEDSGDTRWGDNCINSASLSIQTQGLPLVMSYAPDQAFHELYEDEEALSNGTLFRELNLPFYGAKCGVNGTAKSGKTCGCND